MKTVTMYRPFHVENAFADFDRYLESFFGSLSRERYYSRLPPMDIRETGNSYVLEMELPGYDEKDIHIGLDGGTLTIESRLEGADARDANEGEREKEIYLLRERRASAFSRSFKIPDNADPSSVGASFKNGILVLEMRKRAESQKRVIEINKN